jgi:hypothetical protein
MMAGFAMEENDRPGALVLLLILSLGRLGQRLIVTHAFWMNLNGIREDVGADCRVLMVPRFAGGDGFPGERTLVAPAEVMRFLCPIFPGKLRHRW